jgi:hypothetical protein
MGTPIQKYRGWRMDANGMVIVTKADGTEFAPMLAAAQKPVMASVIERWGPTIKPIAERFDLPWLWLAAFVYQESAGNPRALRHESNGWTGVGLTQITHPSLKAGHTDEELFDPVLNLTIGARYLSNLQKAHGPDFPRLSAAFNAGSIRPSNDNPWGMVMTGAHVSCEVAALNWAVLEQQPKDLDAGERASVLATVLPLEELQEDVDQLRRRHRDEEPAA